MFLIEQIVGSLNDTTIISIFIGLVSIIGFILKFYISSTKDREKYERDRYDSLSSVIQENEKDYIKVLDRILTLLDHLGELNKTGSDKILKEIERNSEDLKEYITLKLAELRKGHTHGRD